ncbi:hypothetical protein [Morganella morganii]|uniref:hypothetical protein n=1 Tax=Morganella morganii TaxID=582 RepID=UPI003DA1AFD3
MNQLHKNEIQITKTAVYVENVAGLLSEKAKHRLIFYPPHSTIRTIPARDAC